jgi:hypothetical protein
MSNDYRETGRRIKKIKQRLLLGVQGDGFLEKSPPGGRWGMNNKNCCVFKNKQILT